MKKVVLVLFAWLVISCGEDVCSIQISTPGANQQVAQNILAAMNDCNADVCVIGFNVGTANTFLHINTRRRDIVVVDCGYASGYEIRNEAIRKTIKSFIKNEYRISTMIITHWHWDHYGFLWNSRGQKTNNGLYDLLISKGNHTIILPLSSPEKISYPTNCPERIVRLTNNLSGFYKIPDKESIIDFIVVRDKGETQNENHNSLVVCIDNVVYPGDIDSGELDLSEITNGSIRGMVFPHHGSTSGSSRTISNQVIDKMTNQVSRFVFIPSAYNTICIPKLSRKTMTGNVSRKLDEKVQKVKPEDLPRCFIITGGAKEEEKNQIGQCV